MLKMPAITSWEKSNPDSTLRQDDLMRKKINHLPVFPIEEINI